MGWLLSQPWMRQDINRCNNYFYDREGISQCHPVTVLFASAIAFLSSRIRSRYNPVDAAPGTGVPADRFTSVG